MASTNQIFIPRSVAADNVDALVKTGVAQVALRNGDIVVLGNKTDGVYALEFEGDRYDLGSKVGLLKANIVKGLSHPETKDELREFLLELSKEL